MSITAEIRQAAESDLLTFIKLVAPHRLLGSIHEELIQWWTRSNARTHQLALIPRGHQKSILMAYRVAWHITKHPDTTILYISATSNLAEKQLGAIKQILTSKIYRKYWPEMVHADKGKREAWNNSEISVDHPKRTEEGVRDPTVFTAGLTTSITGMHCDVAVMDDVVVPENAYTSEGRRKVKSQYSLLSSIENPDAKEWIVGTRYFGEDLYNDLITMEEEQFDSDGELLGSNKVYEVFERQVEDRGDGTGEFLWPRHQRADGTWFGFNTQILARKRAQYLDRTQFYAQYYNNPNNPDGGTIDREDFQYYDKRFLRQEYGSWYFKDQKLNVYAAIDFAFSLDKKADYTAIVVIGIDRDSNIYILDIDRFKTDGKISEYFKHILDLHIRWDFKKLRAEVTVAQQSIVKELKENYIKSNGLSLKIEDHRPNRHQGTKEERMSSILEPRYDNKSIWHYRSGNCQILEEELVLDRPAHDDVKDSLASAIEISIPPKGMYQYQDTSRKIVTHSRFGGVSSRGR